MAEKKEYEYRYLQQVEGRKLDMKGFKKATKSEIAKQPLSSMKKDPNTILVRREKKAT